MDWLEGLNDQQKSAVSTNDKPMLILAGAGTGKTKTIVSKIGYIISNNIAKPSEILGLTFTNKAAKEMKKRLSDKIDVEDIWLGTFHSICFRILKRYSDEIGLDNNFLIADQNDSLQILKKAVQDTGNKPDKGVYQRIASRISKYKDKGFLPDNSEIFDYDSIDGIPLKTVYKKYQRTLEQSNLLDFDDIILKTRLALESDKSLLKDRLNSRFKYVFVDEYQDTSFGQNILIKLLADKSKVCCVGDEDQSIYSWRGAEVSNILKFKDHFPKTNLIKLEENYRSKQNIIKAASSLISNNISRYDKNLRSNLDEGSKVKIVQTIDCKGEGIFIGQEISKLKNKGYNLEDIAILVRSSFQNKALENAFISLKIPYQIIDGVKFHDRKEIKDLVSYIRLIYSERDSISFKRAIGTPKRGIGERTIDNIENYATENNISILQAAKELSNKNHFSLKQNDALRIFVNQIDSWNSDIKNENRLLRDMVENIIGEIEYIQMLKDSADKDPNVDDRISNIRTFLTDLQKHNSIEDFLEYIALVSSLDKESEESAVKIMTIHGSKGLEFDVVFCPGWEKEVFPSKKAGEGKLDRMEEERRLGYVAITRAKKEAIISHADSRFMFGSYNKQSESRFVEELKTKAPKTAIEVIDLVNNFFQNRIPNRSHETFENYKNKNKIKHYNTQQKPTITKTNSGNSSFTIITGMQVNHKKFGKGLIEAVNENFAEVRFEESGIKHMIHKNFLTPLDTNE